jgi:hypothetical protein
MGLSNWIALGALLVAVLGLIPQFYQSFYSKKTIKRKDKKVEETKSEKPDNLSKSEEEAKPWPFMLRILLNVIFAFASLLIEMIIFGIIAQLFGVSMNLDTMPLIWKIVFFSLFLVPGVFLFLALVVLSANTID